MFRKPTFNSLCDPFGSPYRGQKPSLPLKKEFFLPLRLSCKERLFSKTYPSFLTVKEGSTSHLGLLSSGEKKETALLGARNRYVLRLADHQRSTPCYAGWDRLGMNYYGKATSQLQRRHCSIPSLLKSLVVSFFLFL